MGNEFFELDPEAWDELVPQCERRLGYIFNDKELLRSALTHASGADHRLASNERLEFLGDAILGMVVCEYLFDNYPKLQEGDLTKIKSAAVSRRTCAKISASLGIMDFMIVGKGMIGNSAHPHSLLADVMESLIAAIYIDGGIDAARRFIITNLADEILRLGEGEATGNFKSQLQQLSQRQFESTPTYRLLDEKGPDHSKCFKISAQIDGTRFQAAWGRNKKEAEQRAASNALAQLRNEEPPYPGD